MAAIPVENASYELGTIAGGLNTRELEDLYRAIAYTKGGKDGQSSVLKLGDSPSEALERILKQELGLERDQSADCWRRTEKSDIEEQRIQHGIAELLRTLQTDRALPLWHQLCRTAFTSHDNTDVGVQAHRVASIVLSLHQSLLANGPLRLPNDGGVDLDAQIEMESRSSNPQGQLYRTLIDLGSYRESYEANGEGGTRAIWRFLHSLDTTTFSQFEEEKQRVRSAVHRDTAETQASDLEQHLRALGPFSYADLPLQSLIDSASRATSNFLKNHQKNFGAHPFILGLLSLIKTQLEEPQWVCTWTFDDAVFSHSGPLPAFMDDAFQLFQAIGLRPFDQILAESTQALPELSSSSSSSTVAAPASSSTSTSTSSTSTQRAWCFKPHTPNKFLQALKKKLPASKKLEARATGTVSRTTLPRQDLDPATLLHTGGGNCCFPFLGGA